MFESLTVSEATELYRKLSRAYLANNRAVEWHREMLAIELGALRGDVMRTFHIPYYTDYA
jgi:hypothetical protein